MTLIATWYPTEEQKLEFEELWRRVYNSQLTLNVSRVDISEYYAPYTGEYYATVYFVDSPFFFHRELIIPEMIKAGYFTI